MLHANKINLFKALLFHVYFIFQYYTQIVKISVSPYFDNNTLQGSIYGGTQLWIKGNGFDFEGLDNKVFIGTIQCEVQNYFTQQTQLSCIIPAGIYLDYANQNLLIKIISKGTELTCQTDCNFAFYVSHSPFIRAIVPNAVTAGEQIGIKGLHYTNNSSNIRQILIGQGYQCDFTKQSDTDDEDQDYNISRGNYDEVVYCKVGEDVESGDYNIRYAIEGRAGYADVFKSAKSWDYKTGASYQLRVYPKITSVSQNSGYITGSYLTIEGFGFGTDKSKVQVEIDDFDRKMSLKILDVQNDKIQVKVLKDERAAPTTTKVIYLGGTGYTHTYTKNNESDVLSIKLVPESNLDTTYYQQKYVGVFKAPKTGKYKFRLASDDDSKFKIKEVDFAVAYDESSLEDKCSISGWAEFRDYFRYYKYDDATKCEYDLVLDKYYYVYAWQRNHSGPGFLTVSLEIPDEVRTPPRENTKPLVSEIKLTHTHIPEIIEIKLMNATGGTFKILMQQKNSNGDFIINFLTEEIAYNASASTLKSKLREKYNYWYLNITKQLLDSSGQVTTDSNASVGSLYTLTFNRVRPHTALPFLITTDLLGSSTNTVVRTQSPSPAITGSFKLQIGTEKTASMWYTESDQGMFEKLRNLKALAQQGMTVIKNGNNWSENKWHIIWDGLANQTVAISIVESDITGGTNADPAKIEITNLEAAKNDHLFYYQIPPELVRTFHTNPQINVKVNDSYAVCSSRNCDYTVIAATNIPDVSDWSLSTLALSLTIANDTRATGFTWNKDNISVTLGNGNCVITSVSLPTIACTMEANSDGTAKIEAGTNKPEVYLKGLGFLAVTKTQNFALSGTSITPNSGSLGGNQKVTIIGTGFSDDVQVTIDSSVCVKESVNNIQIVCRTPANASAGAQTVTITQGSLTNTSLSYTYDNAKTMTITSLSPITASPVLKNNLTITGTNFGTDKDKVQIYLYSQNADVKKKKDYLCNIKTITDTSIVCRLTGGYTGQYKVTAYNIENGNSISTGTNNLFKYEITVSSYTPNKGSPNGGTILTITGTNFSTVLKDNQVQAGESDNAHFCTILSATTTQLKCQMEPLKIATLKDQALTLYVTGKIVEVASCTNCTYTYQDSLTPSITAINKSSFEGGEQIQLTGTQLKTTGTTKVILHDSTLKKEVTTFAENTATSLKFNMPELPQGVYTLNVLVEDLGYASFNSVSQSVTSILKISSIAPNSGSRGGQEVTITGHGFKSNTKVKIGTQDCLNINIVDSTQIKCRVPVISTDGQQNVQVLNDNITDTMTNGYTVNNLSGKATAISPRSFDDSDTVQINVTADATLAALGGTIKPKLRNINDQTLVIEGTAADFDSSAKVNFTNVPAGLYQLELFEPTKGYAQLDVSSTNVVINYSGQTLTYGNKISSYMGGQEFQVNGKGFVSDGNKNNVEAFICNNKVDVISSSYNQLVLRTSQIITKTTAQTYNISGNQRIEPVDILMTNGSSKNNINDKNYYTSSSGDNCELVLDFGENYKVQIQSIRIFPRLQIQTNSIGDLLQGSNDNSQYTTLVTLEDDLIENWNTFKIPDNQTWEYRYVKYKAKNCRIAEFEVHGLKVYTAFSTDLTLNKCDLKIIQDKKELTASQVVEYRQDSTPTVTSITPSLGPTSGGTDITIAGTNFTANGCTVKIDNVTCVTSSVTATSIACKTGKRTQYVPSTLVIDCANGYAANNKNEYLYIDRWSDSATWGGELPPAEGESVFVPKGQTLLMDVSTPKLKLVTIEGVMMFDDTKDLTLDAHYIVIREGHLMAGMPDKRRTKKLTITLHGVKEDQALPSMGNKLIGNVRGKLDMHGKFIQNTWTMLSTTANKGDTTITVLDDITGWEVGYEIVVASSNRNQNEFEQLKIKSVSGKVITLDRPLQFSHYAATETFNGTNYELRAEVGLLSRNIVVQGDESTMQTRHGVHIMMTGKDDSVQGRFSYIEVRRAGQVFHMGRYPIHFHMTGNCIGSYLEGVAIHHAFNRCTTFHGVHYLTIKKGVYYKNLGHCIFVEDSIESRNVVEKTLVMRTNISSSLLMSDLKAAQFWITRPLNYFMNNHAVGSQKFGFWYDLPSNPTGPSSTNTICPVGERLGRFENNVSHGNAIGLRIYPQYKPLTNPCGSLKNYGKFDITADNPPLKPVFKNVLVYGNGTGFFGRNIGSIVLENMANISNGIGFTFMEPEFEIEEFYPKIKDSIAVSTSAYGTAQGASTGIFIDSSRKHGVKVENVKLINFTNKTFIKACHACDPIGQKNGLGMAPTHFKNISFVNSTFNPFVKFTAPEIGKDLIIDEDGTLFAKMGITGITTGFITPYFKHLENPACQVIENTQQCAQKCIVCPNSIKIERLEIQRTDSIMKGYDLKVFDMTIRNDFTNNITTNDNFGIIKHMEYPKFNFVGWVVPVVIDHKYNFHWNDGFVFRNQIIRNNVQWENSQSIIARFNVTNAMELYDIFYSGFNQAGEKVSNVLIPHSTKDLTTSNLFGDSNYSKENGELLINVGETRGQINVKQIPCRTTCPKEEEDKEEESEFRYWSKAADWGATAIPKAGDSPVIQSGWKMIVDVARIPVLQKLTIHGTLIFQEDIAISSYQIGANQIHITRTGKLLVGTETKTFTKKLDINLHGKQQDDMIVISPTVQPSNKVLLVAGQLSVHASSPNILSTKLQQSIRKGSNIIVIKDNVDWKVGDFIAISSSSQNWDQDEQHEIVAINDRRITLKEAVVNNHYGSTNLVNTKLGSVDMSSEVVLITRNVKIEGKGSVDWGCHIHIVGYTGITSTGSSVEIEGQINLEGVQVNKCGQKDTDRAAIDLRDLKNSSKKNKLINSTISNSLGWAFNIINSNNVTLQKNIIYNSLKYGVYLKNPEEVLFEDNNVMKIRTRPWYNNVQDLDIIIGFYIDDGKIDLVQKKVIIKNNIISGSAWFAWAVPGYQCGTTSNNFQDNVAHSSRAGWFGTLMFSNCQRYSKFTAYRNWEQGFVNRFMVHELQVDNFIMIDNNNAMALNGGSTSDKEFPKSSIKNSVVIGKAMNDCDFCYDNELDCDTNGIYTSLFETQNYSLKFNEYYLPLHNSTFSNYQYGGKQEISNVEFKNFNDNSYCKDEKAFVIRTNNFVQDTSVYVTLKDNTLTNIDHLNKFFFANHTRLKHPAFCAKRDCTGIYNLIIDDPSGNFDLDKKPHQYFGYNKPAGRDGNCTFVEQWNGHQCLQNYALLSTRVTFSDRSPILTPLYLNEYKDFANLPKDQLYANTVDNQKEIPAIIKKQGYMKVEFSQSMPSGNYYKLDFSSNTWAVLKATSRDPATLLTKVNGKNRDPLILPETGKMDWEKHKNDCGAYVFYPKLQTIEWVMNSGNCVVHILQIKSIKASVRLNIPLKDFYNNNGVSNFIDNLSALLSIHPSQIKIVGIQEGSAIVNFVILSNNPTENTAGTNVEQQELKQIEELDKINQKLKNDINSLKVDGAGVLDYSSELEVSKNTDQGYNNKCRFYNENEIYFIQSYIQDYQLRKENTEKYVDVICTDCSQEICQKKIEDACKINKEIFTEQACNPVTDNNNTQNDQSYTSTVQIVLMLLFSILF